MTKPLLSAAIVATLALGAQAHAATEVKLGFIASLSGPLALVGTEMQRGMALALAQLGGKLGGLPVKLSTGDDKAIPSEGVTAASKLIDEDKIDIVTGITPSNVLVATAPAYIDADITVVVALAGANEFAGKKCDPHVFVTSFDNDDWDMVMGKWETDPGFKKIYFIGQDYQAGWEHIAAAQRTFKGQQVGPVFTPLAAVDFAAELAQTAMPIPTGSMPSWSGMAASPSSSNLRKRDCRARFRCSAPTPCRRRCNGRRWATPQSA